MSQVRMFVWRMNVELHVHLDGCIRLETAYELTKQKNLNLPGNGTFEDFKSAIKLVESIDLDHFLSKFDIFLPAFIDDFNAIERVAYEFCQDKAGQGVIYAEAHYSPQLLLSEEQRFNEEKLNKVVESVNKGFARGKKDFGISVKTILACIRGIKGWSTDVLRLCKKYKNEGVVGMDIAGTAKKGPGMSEGELNLFDEDVMVFRTAKEEGIHRTVHAGECGGPDEVQKAIDELFAERIGHGYHCVDDPLVYKRCLDSQIHLECCPWSSFMTGSVKQDVKEHPIAKFNRDGMNFSINTDDPSVTGTTLQDEYNLAKSWGLVDADIIKANMNAALHCFASPEEKTELIQRLKTAYENK
ncbi:adenosine deaminase-like isoform X2 [Artemia franciscana]|uniref:adenosine deaminase-like isoform X2 n=1 Tax=Artemia franciscana TaxID=6661 RepID=UPI0032DB14B4